MKAVTWLLLVAFLLMAGVSNHQAKVIEQQRHTIRQYMGLEDGPDATPQPLPMPKTVVPAPNSPEPQERSTFDQRRLLKTI
jgi:hypothetical protein